MLLQKVERIKLNIQEKSEDRFKVFMALDRGSALEGKFGGITFVNDRKADRLESKPRRGFCPTDSERCLIYVVYRRSQ
jgi:hypothetical protein